MNTRGAQKKSLSWIRLLQQWALTFDKSHGDRAAGLPPLGRLVRGFTSEDQQLGSTDGRQVLASILIRFGIPRPWM